MLTHLPSTQRREHLVIDWLESVASLELKEFVDDAFYEAEAVTWSVENLPLF